MITETIESREAALSGRLGFLNTGTGAHAHVQIYGGTRPANASDAPGTPLLVAIRLANPAGTVAGGVLTLAPHDTGLIMETGAPTWARVVNRNGATVCDMNAGIAGSRPGGTNPECVLSTTPLFAGGQVSITAAVLG